MNNFKLIEKNLNYNFLDYNLLKAALTHPSVKNKGDNNFEYLEFLGDRVIGLCIAQMLKNQGSIKEIAIKHANLVSTKTLAKIAYQWEIQKFLQHEIQELSSKVLADTIEAIIGAVFLDSNLIIVENIITKFWLDFVDKCSIEPKMELQELAQKSGQLPIYKVIDEKGSDNKKQYTIMVKIDGRDQELTAKGEGKSKQEASKNAAQNLLDKLK